MDVELRAGTTLRLSDATNYLGGIADVLESKRRREFASGALVHLGYQRNVAVYEDDSQIKEVHYRSVESDTTSYRVTLRALE